VWGELHQLKLEFLNKNFGTLENLMQLIIQLAVSTTPLLENYGRSYLEEVTDEVKKDCLSELPDSTFR